MARLPLEVSLSFFALPILLAAGQIFEDEYFDDTTLRMTRRRPEMRSSRFRAINPQNNFHDCKARGTQCTTDSECCSKHCAHFTGAIPLTSNNIKRCRLEEHHGWPDPDRIIGGVKAERGQNPSMVQLRLDDNQFCGGTIISRYYVLTAAHCLDSTIDVHHYNIVTDSIHLDDDRWGDADVYNISHIEIHKDFRSVEYASDIALLRTSTPIQFYKKYVQPAKIPRRMELQCAKGTVWGWGYLMDGAEYGSEYLFKVEVPKVSFHTCYRNYKDMGLTIYNGWQLCYGSRGKDSCQGDSGGPLTCSSSPDYVIGIVSYGTVCGSAKYPGVYTDVSFFHDWIHSKMK